MLYSRLFLPLPPWVSTPRTTRLGPDSQPQDGAPKGTVTKFTLAPGKDYPGTPHNCAVYVPAQYDAEQADAVHDLS